MAKLIGNIVVAGAPAAQAIPVPAADAPVRLKRNNIDPKRVIPEATLVPSGVVEVAKLQFKEGYAYLRP